MEEEPLIKTSYREPSIREKCLDLAINVAVNKAATTGGDGLTAESIISDSIKFETYLTSEKVV
jgi:hypothetical protein